MLALLPIAFALHVHGPLSARSAPRANADMQTQDTRRPGASSGVPPPAPRAVKTIGSVWELDEAILDAQQSERLMVVKFFAPWCRSCKSIKPRFDKLARARDDIAFYEVSFVAAKETCKHCKITYLPTMHVYAKGELVGAPSITLKSWPAFDKDVTNFEKELRGIYVPKNQCDDNYWKSCAVGELSEVTYDDEDGADADGSAGAVGGPLGSRSEVV